MVYNKGQMCGRGKNMETTLDGAYKTKIMSCEDKRRARLLPLSARTPVLQITVYNFNRCVLAVRRPYSNIREGRSLDFRRQRSSRPVEDEESVRRAESGGNQLFRR